jgi:hypothetical protein
MTGDAMTPHELPALDSDPDHWGPDHDDLTITDDEIAEGNRQGAEIDTDDDDDNGLSR